MNHSTESSPDGWVVDTSGLKSNFFFKWVLKSSIFFDFSPDVSTVQPSGLLSVLWLMIVFIIKCPVVVRNRKIRNKKKKKKKNKNAEKEE